MFEKARQFLNPTVSEAFLETTFAATHRKIIVACRVTILLWIVTAPLEIVLVPDKIVHFFGIRIVVIAVSIALLLYGRRSDPRSSYRIVWILFAVVTAGFIGFSYLYQAGLQVINQALLSFVFLLGLSVVWPPLYTLIMGVLIATSTLSFQYALTGPSEKMFVDTVYLYSATAVATILTRLNYRVEESRHATSEQLRQIVRMHRKLEIDLEAARQTQLSLIPTQMPIVPGLIISARYRAMDKLGGDFYGFQSGADSLGVLIADVSGHGVPAALIVSTVNIAFNYARGGPLDPPLLLSQMNEALFDNIGNEFVTAASATFDCASDTLRVGNAGHPAVLVLRRSTGELLHLRPAGQLLGILPDASFEAEAVRLDPGDRVLLYTDGAFEAANSDNELYGMERLEQFLRDNHELSAEEFLDRLLESVIAWCNRPEGISDDVALVVLDKT